MSESDFATVKKSAPPFNVLFEVGNDRRSTAVNKNNLVKHKDRSAFDGLGQTGFPADSSDTSATPSGFRGSTVHTSHYIGHY